MKIDDLPNFILLLVLTGMLLGVGLIVILSLGDSARNTYTATDENHTFFVAGTALTQTEVRDFTSLTNLSTTLTLVTDYNVSIGESSTTVVVSSAYNNSQLNATYRYYDDSTTTSSMDNVNTALTPITSTWFSLIVTIMVLSIVLSLVIKSFGGSKR